MKTIAAVRGILLALTFVAFALVLSACGRSQRNSVIPAGKPADTQKLWVAPPVQAADEVSLDEALTELDALETPEGVDEALWGELKDALKEALVNHSPGTWGSLAPQDEEPGWLARPTHAGRNHGRDARATSGAPTGEANKVTDLTITDNGDGTYTLSWHYRNLGDYDQNGTVGISDITPIAMHYGETCEPTDENCLLAVIDGSGNGVVDIADITPLAQSFGTEIAYYSLRASSQEWGAYTAIRTFGFGEATGGEIGRKVFESALTPEPSTWYRVVPFDSAWNEGLASEAVQWRVDVPPEILSVSPISGTVGTEAQFSAVVTGTEPMTYAWDFGGGAYPNTSAAETPTVTLGDEGAYECSLAVGNAYGSDNLGFTLTVYLEPTYAVSGTVRRISDGAGLGGFEVSLEGHGITFTNSAGYFEFAGIPSGGPYTLTASLEGWITDPPSRSVAVSNADVENQDFTASWEVPQTPTDVQASDGTFIDKIQVSWTESANADYYKVYRATSQYGTYEAIGQPVSSPYNDLVEDTSTYWYKVRAYNSGGHSESSEADSGYKGTEPLPPDPPTSLEASDGTYLDRIRITWTASSGADLYLVYRSTSESGTYTFLGQTNSLSYYDTDVPDTDTYWYKAKARNAIGDSDFSNADDGYKGSDQPPDPPTNLQASDGTYTNRIQVTWTASNGASYYMVYLATSQFGTYSYRGQSSTLQYNDYVSDTSTYWYKARAHNANGDSDFSNADSGYKGTAPPPPDPPTNLQASDGTYTDRIQITWTASSGADYYKVYRATSQYGSYSYREQCGSSPYNDFVSDAGTYWYKAKAHNENGDSGYSSADSGYKGSEPVPPTNLKASDGTYTDIIRITWTGSSGADSYKLYRATSEFGGYSLVASAIEETAYDDVPGDTNIYWYKAKAHNEYGDSGYSNANSGYRGTEPQPPDPPTDLEASDGAYKNKIYITWTGSSGTDYYKLWRATSQFGIYELIAAPAATSYNDYVLDYSTYWYKAQAHNENGDSDYSNADSGYRREPQPPDPPTNLEATDGEFSDKVRITWDASENATEYSVYRATTQYAEYCLLDYVTGTSYDDYVPDDNTYWYKARAHNDDGDSGYSNANSGYSS